MTQSAQNPSICRNATEKSEDQADGDLGSRTKTATTREPSRHRFCKLYKKLQAVKFIQTTPYLAKERAQERQIQASRVSQITEVDAVRGQLSRWLQNLLPAEFISPISSLGRTLMGCRWRRPSVPAVLLIVVYLLLLPAMTVAGGGVNAQRAAKTCSLLFQGADLLAGEVDEPGFEYPENVLPESKVPDRVMEPDEAMVAMKEAIRQHTKERGHKEAFAWAVADGMVTLAMQTVADGIRKMAEVLATLNNKQVDQMVSKLGGVKSIRGVMRPNEPDGLARLMAGLGRWDRRLEKLFDLFAIKEVPSSGNFTQAQWKQIITTNYGEIRERLSSILFGEETANLVTAETVNEVIEKHGKVETLSYQLLRFDTEKIKQFIKSGRAPQAIQKFFAAHVDSGLVDRIDYFADKHMRNLASRVVRRWVREYRDRMEQNRPMSQLGPDPRENPNKLLQMVIAERIREINQDFIERGMQKASKWAEDLADAVEAGPGGQHKNKGVSLDGLAPYWSELLHDYYREIDRHVPVRLLTTASPSDRQVLARVEGQVLLKDPRDFLPKIGENGGGNHMLELHQSGLTLSWVPDLGTAFLHPKGVFPGQNAGLPMVALLHGAGTTMSHGRSFSASMSRVAKVFGLDKQIANIAAPDNLHAGTGVRSMKIPDVRVWAANARMVGEYLMAQQEGGQGAMGQRTGEQSASSESPAGVRPPLIAIGRSAGATTMDMLALAYPSKDPYDVRLAFSFSNPLTIAQQIRMVLLQVEQKMLRAIDPTSLSYFRDVAEHYMQAFKASSAEERRAFAIASLGTIESVGQSDYDGGPSVWRDHVIYREKFNKTSVVHWVHDSLAGTKFVDVEVNENYNKLSGFFEGTHFLIGNQKNFTQEDAKSTFPGLPMEMVPRIESQTLEMAALPYAGMDHLIGFREVFRKAIEKEKSPLVLETLRLELAKADRLALYLSQQQMRDGSQPGSYLEWFADKNYFALNKYSPEQLREHNAQKLRMLEQYKRNGETGEGVESSGLSWVEYEMRDMLARLQRIQDEFALGRKDALKYFIDQGYIELTDISQ